MFLRTDDGALLNAVAFGAGPRTLVAHGGWTGSWELWQGPFEVLSARGWRCIAYDHRGTGATVADPATITSERLVLDLVAVLDAFAVERCVLAGESMGAVTVGEAAVRLGARVAGLVLVGGMAQAPVRTGSTFVAGVRADWPATAAAFVEACVPEPDADHLRRWGRQILARSDAETAALLLERWDGVGFDPAAVRAPALVIHGERDAIVPVAAAHHLAASLTDAELHVLPGTGHVPTITRPDVVAELIDARFPWRPG